MDIDLYMELFFSVSSMNGEVAEEQSPGGQRSAEIINSLLMTPKPITALISGEKGSSSVVKYKVTTTPGYVDTSPKQQLALGHQCQLRHHPCE